MNTTTDTRTVVTSHLTDRTRRMREAQQMQAEYPNSRKLKALAKMHGEAFCAVYMLALDLFTPQEVTAIVKAAEPERS